MEKKKQKFKKRVHVCKFFSVFIPINVERVFFVVKQYFCIDYCRSKPDNEASLDTLIMHDNISRSTMATAEIQGENQHVNGKKL